MCLPLFLLSFLAGALVGSAVAVSVALLVLGGPMATAAVVWGGGLLGSLAIFATALAWRVTTSSACRSVAQRG
jgi:hypothetical protein